MRPTLEIELSGAAGVSLTKGPYAALRFEGEVLREVAGGPVIARHAHHAWHADGATYVRLDCRARVQVHFEQADGSRSTMYGPYESVSFLNGIAYANHEIFAFVDRTVPDWYSHEEERHWAIMIVQAAF